MITTIDKAGRIVIPKPLRDAMGLRPGARLDVDYVDGRIAIEYAPAAYRMRIGEDGFPIIELASGEGIPPLTDELVRETRDAVYAERDARWV